MILRIDEANCCLTHNKTRKLFDPDILIFMSQFVKCSMVFADINWIEKVNPAGFRDIAFQVNYLFSLGHGE
jgi:hypothetical protein